MLFTVANFVLFILFFDYARCFVRLGGNITPNIRIKAHENEQDSSPYVVKDGNHFFIECIAEGLTDSAPQNLIWYKWHNKDYKMPINSLGDRINTAFRVDSENNQFYRTLSFIPIQFHDDGVYVCQANLDSGRHIAKDVTIKVVGDPVWRTKNSVVGGMLHDSLVIDCGADGMPNSSYISIMDDHGHALNESTGFVVVGNEVNIKSLSRKIHQGKKIVCLATILVEVKDKLNSTQMIISTSRNELTIDVWFHPKFLNPEVKRYAVEGHNSVLSCTVIESNPPLSTIFNQINIMRGTESIIDDTRHTILRSGSNTLQLRINDVKDGDFGRYTCKASNGKAQSEASIILEKARKPKQPSVSLYASTNNSITWRIVNELGEEELPILGYSLQYIEPKLIKDINGSSEEIDDKVHLLSFIRVASNLYEVKDLKPYIQYEFEFSSKSEIGEGDPITFKTATGMSDIVDTNKSSTHTYIVWLLIITSGIVLIF